MGFLQSMGASVKHLPFRTGKGSLRSTWLLLARVVWVGLAAVAVGLFAMSLLAGFTQLHRICTHGTCPIFWQLSPHDLQALERLGISLDLYAAYTLALAITLMLSYSVVGIIIFWQKRPDGLTLFLSLTLITLGAVGLFADQLVELQPAWKAAITLVSFASTASTLIFVYVFPDGRFVPRWMAWLVVVWVVLEVIYSFFPDSPLSQRIWPLWLSTSIWLSSWVIGFLSQIYRYVKVSTQIERQQTKWVVFGLAVSLCLLLLDGIVQALLSPSPSAGEAHLLSLLVSQFLGALAFALPPICIGIAILRSRLWGIDLIINRTLVYGLLSACVVGIYILVVGYLSTLFRVSDNLFIALLATSLVAILFQPLRLRFQRAVNRLMYGQRDEPYAVMTHLSQRLEGTLAPEAVLPIIVETVAQALKLPYAAISLKQDDAFTVAASYGKPIDNPLIFSLAYQGETIGQLLLAARTPGEAFTAGDRRLLDELARHAGLAAHSIRLTADLQRSRERLVTAREEERRRLRRDLHDGLGSALTSFMFKLDATDELLERDPARARALLADVRAQTQASIDDIRRLVYDLRPPILDEWGLVAALREHVVQYNLKNVRVCIDAPESLPPLPAAVEVAVYRMVLEALANIIKHAQATTCAIRLAHLPDALTVEVQDNGVGRPSGSHAGVGITAMYERAEELGGCCVIEDVVPQGTRVFARFPLRRE